MTKILGISGRAQAGKTTSANWLSGLYMQRAGLINEHFVNHTGDLFVPVEIDGVIEDRCIQFNRPSMWLNENVYPHVKQYSFADPLKRFIIEVFGASWEQCYGTNEQKNEESHLKWSCFSDEIRKKYKKGKKEGVTWRDLMQVYGTDIVREIDPDAWVRALKIQILAEQSEVAIVHDIRFPNEVTGLQEIGGKVLRYLRNPLKSDHESESALDPENFDQTKFDGILDNSEMTIGEQNKATVDLLKIWDYIDFEFAEVDSKEEKKEETKKSELPPTREATAKLK